MPETKNETEEKDERIQNLKVLKEKLWKSFLWTSAKMDLYIDDESKYPKWVDSQQKLAKSLLDCIDKENRLGIRDNDQFSKHIIALLAKIKEVDRAKREESDKKTLMTIKKWIDNELK